MSCTVCHTEFPILTSFGRQFKLGGYTLSAGDSELPPLAVMLQPSFTHTQKSQPGGAAPGFSNNDNYAMTQASIFYAGRLFGPYAKDLFGSGAADVLNKIGVFVQTTYDGVGKTWSWDNTEIRYASAATWGDQPVTFGVYANNNPTLEDPWNSSPAWGFPFTGSGLAPSPAAATLVNGGLAGQVAGLGAYAMVANAWYFDVGAYHTLGTKIQKSLGVDPGGEADIGGVAPYWRIAYDHPVGNGSWQIGTFGLLAPSYPDRDRSAGHDRVTDVGFDSQYQTAFGQNDLTLLASVILERQSWTASQSLGNTAESSGSLHEFKATVEYLRSKTYGATVQYFAIDGSSDSLLYGDSQTGTPGSDGFIFQLNYLPLNRGGGPKFWPRSNVKLSLQYVLYNRFDGARTNYDGAGANARDNNTLYLEAWIAF